MGDHTKGTPHRSSTISKGSVSVVTHISSPPYTFVNISQYISVYLSISRYISVYLGISRYTSVYLSISQYTSVYLSIPQYISYTSVYLSIHQYISYTSVYLSIHQYISVYYACTLLYFCRNRPIGRLVILALIPSNQRPAPRQLNNPHNSSLPLLLLHSPLAPLPLTPPSLHPPPLPLVPRALTLSDHSRLYPTLLTAHPVKKTSIDD